MVRWDKIKDGFRGFEKLAVEFVRAEESRAGELDWTPTPATRDGNKDGVAVFVNWATGSAQETQWWMEAKYSTKTKNLTRYRLDSTIVSAFANQKNIEKLVFITNVNVKSKTISDIQLALLQSATCKDAVFYSGQHLEEWLLEDYERYSRYFDDLQEDQFNAIERPKLKVLTNALEVYPQRGVFKEPVEKLFHGESYITNFEVYARSKISNVSFRIETDGLIFNQPEAAKRTIKRTLNPGMNRIELPIILDTSTKLTNGTLFIRLDDKQFHSSSSLQFCGAPLLTLNAQENAIELAHELWEQVELYPRTLIAMVVTGDSGTGKSQVGQNVKNEVANRRVLLHEKTFANDQEQNIRKLSQLILSFLFPYIPPEDIDVDYVKSLDWPKAPKAHLETFVSALERNDYKKLSNCFSASFFETVIPETAQANARLLLCDDVNKLDAPLQEALFLFIDVLREKGFSILSLLIGQKSDIWHGLEHFQSHVDTKKAVCSITLSDIENELNNLPFSLDGSTLERLFGSVIEAAMFLEHLRYISKDIRTLEDFKIAYTFFRNSHAFREYVAKRFDDAISQMPEVQDLLTFIYYCPETQPQSHYGDKNAAALEHLFNRSLIKLNADEEITPFHDIYSEIFRESHSLDISKSFCLENASEVGHLTLALARTGCPIEKDLLAPFEKLFSQQRYSALFQLLDPYFENEERRSAMKRRCTPVHYFKLFWLYAYANANAGQRESGLKYFNELRLEIGTPQNSEIAAIKYLATFEAFNSSYEHMKYREAERLWEDLNAADITSCMESTYAHSVQSCQHHAISIHIMLDTEQGKDSWTSCENYINDLLEQEVFAVNAFDIYRLAMTQITQQRDAVLALITKCKDALSDRPSHDKGRLMTHFAVEYFDCIEHAEHGLNELYETHNNIRKHFYNDYNRHLPAIAFLHLKRGNIDAAQSLLYEYQSTERKRSDRQDAIHKITAAAVLLKTGDDVKAVQNLLNSAQELLSMCPNYLPVIRHNSNLAQKASRPIKFELYFGQELQKDVFYYDARFIY